MTITANIGTALLAIGLIVWGILLILGIAVPGIVLGIWMIVTGIFLLLGKQEIAYCATHNNML